MKFTGECNCGDVSFEVSGSMPAMYKCYCRLCQKQSGTGSNAATIVPDSNFRWLQGKDSVVKWQKSTGFNSHFCPICGCPCPNTLGEKFVWIPMGLIERMENTVVVDLFEDYKPAWETSCRSEIQLSQGADSVAQLFELLSDHART